MDVLVLNRAQVEALLDLDELLAGLREGFDALADGRVVAPHRNELTVGDGFLLGNARADRSPHDREGPWTIFEHHDPEPPGHDRAL